MIWASGVSKLKRNIWAGILALGVWSCLQVLTCNRQVRRRHLANFSVFELRSPKWYTGRHGGSSWIHTQYPHLLLENWRSRPKQRLVR